MLQFVTEVDYALAHCTPHNLIEASRRLFAYEPVEVRVYMWVVNLFIGMYKTSKIQRAESLKSGGCQHVTRWKHDLVDIHYLYTPIHYFPVYASHHCLVEIWATTQLLKGPTFPSPTGEQFIYSDFFSSIRVRPLNSCVRIRKFLEVLNMTHAFLERNRFM